MNDAALAQEVKNLRASINDNKTAHAESYSAAQEVETSIKAKYADEPNVLAAMTDSDFDEIDGAYKAADTLNETVANLDNRLKSVLARNGQTLILPSGADSPEVASGVGERILASEQYAAAKQAKFARGSLSPIEVASADELRRTFMAASDGAGLIPIDQKLNPPVNIPRRAPRLMDFITVSSTDVDVVEWARQSVQTDNVVNKAAGGAASNESVYEWEKVKSNVERIPTHIVVPKSQLADQARLKTELEAEGRRAVLLQVENQILSGDGTGENLPGVMSTAGISTVAMGTDTIADATHKGITAVRIGLEDDITAIGVHPNDYETYALDKDGNGNYLSGRGPHESTARTMWGYPALVSTVFTEGTIVPANWSWFYLWIRSGLTIESGYINQQMIEDLMTLAFEFRAAGALKQPKAFATVTGVNA